MDATQAFDFEHKMINKIREAQKLRIGVVGFGTFGQFLAKRFVNQVRINEGHTRIACRLGNRLSRLGFEDVVGGGAFG